MPPPHPGNLRRALQRAWRSSRPPLLQKPPARGGNAQEHAIRQVISRALVADHVVDIFAAAGLKHPDLSILSDEFLAEVRGLPQRNLAVELLQKLLKGEIKARAA